MNQLKVNIYAMLLVLFTTSTAYPAVFFVKKTGSDSNNCTAAQSESTPKLTINSALACFDPATAGSGAGHTIRIYAGTYAEAINNNIPGGTSFSNPFIIESNSSDVVNIQPTSCSALIVMDIRRTNTKFVIIRSGAVGAFLRITAGNGTCTNDAVKLSLSSSLGAPSFVRFQRVEVSNALNHGIQFTSSATNNEVLDSWIHDNGDNDANVDDTHGLYIHSNDNRFEGNLIESNCNRGLQIYNSGTNNAHRNIVRRNIFRNNGTCETSSQVVLSSGNDIEFSRNVVYNGNQHPLGVNQNGPARTRIFNNTFYNHGTSSPCINIQAGASGTIIKNNICRNPTGSQSLVTDAGTGTVSSNNLTTGTDPLFIDAGSANFALQSGSPAINAGTSSIATGISVTYNGAAPDIGAHETIGFLSCSVANGDANNIRVLFETNVHPPIAVTDVTGIAVVVAGTGRTETTDTTIGSNRIDFGIDGSAITNGQTVTWAYSTTGNISDSAFIGGTMNQRLNAVTAQNCTNNVGAGGGTAVLTQASYRFHGLRGQEDQPIRKPHASAANSTNIKAAPGSQFRIRINITCTVAACPPLSTGLQYNLNSGGWVDVPETFGAGNIRFIGTASITDVPAQGTPTTAQIGANNKACLINRTANTIPVINLAQDEATECEYILELDTDITPNTDSWQLRVANLQAYTVTPTVTAIDYASSR